MVWFLTLKKIILIFAKNIVILIQRNMQISHKLITIFYIMDILSHNQLQQVIIGFTLNSVQNR